MSALVRQFRPDEGIRIRPFRPGEPTGTCGLCRSTPSLLWAIPSLGLAASTCRPCAPRFLHLMLDHDGQPS